MRSSEGRTVGSITRRIGMAVAAGIVGALIVGVCVARSTAEESTGSPATPARSASARIASAAQPPASAAQPPASVAPPPAPRAAITRPVVVLYGDSLAWEARDQFTADLASHPEVRVVTRTFPGTAICDFLDDMRNDVATLRPGAVVVEFSGNAFTPCMKDATGAALTGDAYLARYEADAETVMAIFEPIGARVFFAGAPIGRLPSQPGGFNGGHLDPIYGGLARSHAGTAQFVDAGAAVLDGGRWTETLPCLPDEPCTGGTNAAGRPVNVVRAPDGIHFCPARAQGTLMYGCPIWSSGAFRYARAMARPVIEALAA